MKDSTAQTILVNHKLFALDYNENFEAVINADLLSCNAVGRLAVV